MKLPEFAVRRPYTVLMIFLGIALMGAISLFKLNLDFLPDIEPPAISVLVPYPGATASDVENDVTKYLEDQLSTVNNLDKLKSLSKDNLAMVTCLFDWGTDLDVAVNDVRDKLDLAKPDIREHAPDAEEPMIFKFSWIPSNEYPASEQSSFMEDFAGRSMSSSTSTGLPDTVSPYRLSFRSLPPRIWTCQPAT